MLVGLVVLSGFALTVKARPRSSRAPQRQLPAAFATAVSSAFPGARVDELKQDTDDGVALYSVDRSTGAEVEVTLTAPAPRSTK